MGFIIERIVEKAREEVQQYNDYINYFIKSIRSLFFSCEPSFNWSNCLDSVIRTVFFRFFLNYLL